MRKKKKLHILITAGATREPIDPVRYISNYATGHFGYELAKEAASRGHKVIVVHGQTSSPKPQGVTLVETETAQDMKREVERHYRTCDCLFMNAAVSDYRPSIVSKNKIKRGTKKTLTLKLRQNPDILGYLGQRKHGKYLVGFALESKQLEINAKKKLKEKNADIIVATAVNSKSYPFGHAKLTSLIVNKRGEVSKVYQMTKQRLARILLDNVEEAMLQ